MKKILTISMVVLMLTATYSFAQMDSGMKGEQKGEMKQQGMTMDDETAKGGDGGGKLIIIGSCLTCYKILSSVVISTLQSCGLQVGNVITINW